MILLYNLIQIIETKHHNNVKHAICFKIFCRIYIHVKHCINVSLYLVSTHLLISMMLTPLSHTSNTASEVVNFYCLDGTVTVAVNKNKNCVRLYFTDNYSREDIFSITYNHRIGIYQLIKLQFKFLFSILL